MKRLLCIAMAGLVLSTLNSQLSTARAQGTAFIHRGQYSPGGIPANGNYDMAFQIYDAATGGPTYGQGNVITGVGITNGQFTVTLDFGSGVFTGPPRWLQTIVTNNVQSIVLSPREPLLPHPYAIYAESAGSGGGLTLPYSGGASSSGSIFTLTNRGSGPSLDASDGSEDTLIDGNSITFTRTTGPGYIYASNRMDFETGAGGPGGDAGANLILYSGQISSFNGELGIGTTAPAAKLHVVTSSNSAVAISGTNSYSGVYGQLAVSATKGSGGDFPNNSYIGVYGNNGINASSYYNGNYAAYFDGLVYVHGDESLSGNQTVNGSETVNGNVSVSGSVVLASPLRFPGAGAETSTPVFTHKATALTVVGNKTYINNPVCNGRPDAILIITENWSAGNKVGNPNVVGVYYDTGRAQWAIFVDNNTPMPIGVAYNVMVTLP